jgi:hypothetical protein
MNLRFRTGVKICGAAGVVLLAVIALCPADRVPRTDLGFELDQRRFSTVVADSFV